MRARVDQARSLRAEPLQREQRVERSRALRSCVSARVRVAALRCSAMSCASSGDGQDSAATLARGDIVLFTGDVVVVPAVVESTKTSARQQLSYTPDR